MPENQANPKQQTNQQPRANQKPLQSQRPQPQKRRVDDNVVFIGKKPVMSYVLAVVTQFGKGQNEVTLKARGKSISTAVDVAEIVRKRFVSDAKILNIAIDTEEIAAENEKINVSTIEITITKAK